MSMRRQLKADLALLFVTLGWGASFMLTKNALAHLETYNFLAIRFFIAFAISAIIFRKQMLKIEKKTLKYGIILGIILFASYAFQTVGLAYTTVSKSAFITGFNVVLVPFFSAMLLKNKLDLRSYLSVGMAFVGLAFLTLNQSITNINIGDLYTFICAIITAAYIILVGKYTVKVESISFAIIQIGTVCVLSLITSLITETPRLTTNKIGWISIIILSVVCTSGAFIIQMVAQKFTSPTHTALIYTGEPVFAGIFGYIFIHEVLGLKGIIGAFLILSGMLISEIDFKEILRKSFYKNKTKELSE
jgi:drug/metabolite transporter (DMT)-like permease